MPSFSWINKDWITHFAIYTISLFAQLFTILPFEAVELIAKGDSEEFPPIFELIIFSLDSYIFRIQWICSPSCPKYHPLRILERSAIHVAHRNWKRCRSQWVENYCYRLSVPMLGFWLIYHKVDGSIYASKYVQLKLLILLRRTVEGSQKTID